MVFAKAVNYKPIPLFIAFMIMSAGLAMFIDSITVILYPAWYYEGILGDQFFPVGSILPGDHEGSDRSCDQRQDRSVDRYEGERHHRKA